MYSFVRSRKVFKWSVSKKLTELNLPTNLIVICNRFPIFLNLLMDSSQTPFRRLVTWMQICASLNHRKVKKAEFSRLIFRKPAADLDLSSAVKKFFECLVYNHL